ncbi:MAG: zf-HC2 domain-containing protein [Prolixibacteraceae bacterium]
MKNMMNKIMLTCRKATFYSSVKNYKKLSRREHIQLNAHLMMCPHCRRFNKQSELIDKNISRFLINGRQSEEQLSEEKKSEIKNTVNHYLN